VLRSSDEQASTEPTPGLSRLPDLLGGLEAAGFTVRQQQRGESRELPAMVDLAAYRIVQEAVTNAMRHSGAGGLRIRICHRPGEVEVLVEDDGRGLDGVGVPGHGLRGISERAELYGGSVAVSPGPRGGTRVHARLPVRSVS